MRQVEGMVGEFQPEVVLSLMETSDYYGLAEKYARTHGLPLYLIVHDTNEDFEPVFPWAKGSQLAKDRRIYRFAKERFCVSPEMAAFNEQRFGVPGKVLYPISDPKIQPRPLEWSKALRQPPHLTIGYAGSTSYGYGEMMLKSLPQLAEAGARLELCCPEPSGSVADLLESPIVKWHGYKEASEAIRILQERCDVLWLPYLDPAGSYERLYSTHFPSKLVDYAAAGMPVWVTGPSLATGVRFYLHFSAFADADIRKAKKTITEVLQNQAIRMRLIEEMDKKRKELSTNIKEFIL